MVLPLSGNALKKLTRRLRNGTETPDDLHALADVRLYYKDVLDLAHEEVERLCAAMPHAEPMAPRVKTFKTTMEKLRRQSDLHSLAQIRDLAGMRVVVHGSRARQDQVANQIAELLSTADRPPKFIDRRADPRSGYRAVHFEIRRDGILIEVQIRTAFQHRWAELFERTADKLGRGLRYGESVPELKLASRERAFVGVLWQLSDLIDRTERLSTDDTGLFDVLDDLLGQTSTNLEQL